MDIRLVRALVLLLPDADVASACYTMQNITEGFTRTVKWESKYNTFLESNCLFNTSFAG